MLFRRPPSHRLLPHRLTGVLLPGVRHMAPTNPDIVTPDPNLAARPLQGMDMRKVISYPWINVLETRKPMPSGYQNNNWAGKHITTLSAEETVNWFTQKNTWNEFTMWQLLKSFWPFYWYGIVWTLNLLYAAGPTLLYVFWSMRFEPPELQIEPDEYFDHFRWHYYGPELDHHAFIQYLEARRAKKWRDPTINPLDWIPPQFRGKDGFQYP